MIQPPPAPLAWLNDLLATHSVTGAALALVRNGQVEVMPAGVRDAATLEPVSGATVFDAASLSKPMVAYAVLQLVDAGVLALDEPLRPDAPWIVADDARSAHITVRHVLTHTCGLQNLRGTEPLRLYFPPGAWFSYSSVGFAFLQAAVEARTGEPLEALMQRLVLQPLGLHASSFEWRQHFADHVASPHEAGVRLDKHHPPVASASYSLQTTAADYGAFVAAVLRGDRLKPATWQQWMTPTAPVPRGAAVHQQADPPTTEEGVAWGLGWGLEPRQGTFFQWGKMTGVRAFAMGCPATQSGVVLLTNSNTGLRLMTDVTARVLPGEHPAIGWLTACVTE